MRGDGALSRHVKGIRVLQEAQRVEDLGRGQASPTEQDLDPCHVTAEHLEVASSAFDRDGDDEQESPRRVLRSEIYRASARAGGSPIWLQGDEHDGDFLLQFDESFANVNLGDCGVMYVFTDTQFWQCH